MPHARPSPLTVVLTVVVGTGAAVLALFGAGFGVAMLLVPLYWQVVRGESATTAGLHLAPVGIAADGVGSLAALPAADLAVLAPERAGTFRAAFWFPVALMVAAGLVALAGLRDTTSPAQPTPPATRTPEPLP